jgi:hypothetical protein
MNSVCYLFTHCQSFPQFCHHQVAVSITICCPECSDIKYTSLPSPIYQNIVNLVVRSSIRRCPSNLMNVTMWEHCAHVLAELSNSTEKTHPLLCNYYLSLPCILCTKSIKRMQDWDVPPMLMINLGK